jgi:hypothetical protein
MIISVFSKENNYTFNGEFTYLEILSALSFPTQRSVLGYSDILQLKRNFTIVNKNFFVAVDHVNKNLLTDGYKISFDENSFYILKNDTMNQEIDSKYKIFLPYSKQWVLTNDKQLYLNSIESDKKLQISDSIKKYEIEMKLRDSLQVENKSNQIYKCVLHIIGFTEQNSKQDGIDVPNLINANFNITVGKKIEMPTINFDVSAVSGKKDDKTNFDRKIVVYCRGDSLIDLVFGSEIRRVNSAISDNNIIKTQYESIYDGLTIKLSRSFYKLTYKLGNDEISLSGVPNQVSSGSSFIEQKTKKRNLLLFRFTTKSNIKFNLISKLEVTQI